MPKYKLGEYRFDSDTRVIDYYGKLKSITPKAAHVLLILIENAQCVVTREYLLDNVWPNVTVLDEAITHTIAHLRRALESPAGHASYIKTIHKSGYLLTIEPELLSEPKVESLEPKHFNDLQSELKDSEATIRTETIGKTTQEAEPMRLPRIKNVSQKEHKEICILSVQLEFPKKQSSIEAEELKSDLIDDFTTIVDGIIQQNMGTPNSNIGGTITAVFTGKTSSEIAPYLCAKSAMQIKDCITAILSEHTDLATGYKVILHAGTAVISSEKHENRPLVSTATTLFRQLDSIVATSKTNTILLTDSFYTLAAADIVANRTNSDFSNPSVYELLDLKKKSEIRAQPQSNEAASFFGRNIELENLHLQLAESIRTEKSRVITIIGEAGMGKSRLLREFVKHCGLPSKRILITYCFETITTKSFNPLQGILRAILDLTNETHEVEASEKIRTFLPHISDSAVNNILSFAGITKSKKEKSAASDEDRQETTQYVQRILRDYAYKSPSLFIFEDTHWLDQAGLDYIKAIILALSQSQALVLLAQRPDGRRLDQTQIDVTDIQLAPLNQHDCQLLALELAKNIEVTDPFLARIAQKAHGIPFYVEELIRSYSEDPFNKGSIPKSITDVISSRIDNLSGEEYSLLKLCSIIGSILPINLLANASGHSQEELAPIIEKLVAKNLLKWHSIEADKNLSFAHDLIQEVTYKRLREIDRKKHHGELADVILRDCRPLAESNPQLLARHLEQTGRLIEAIKYYELGGDLAVSRFAETEAYEYYAQAISLYEKLEITAAEKRNLLSTMLKQSTCLQVVWGGSIELIGKFQDRAIKIAREVGTHTQTFEALWGKWRHTYLNNGQEATALSHELKKIAEDNNDSDLILQAKHAIWSTANVTNEFGSAHDCAAEAIANYDLKSKSLDKYLFGGHHPIVCAMGTLANTYWLRGEWKKSAEHVKFSYKYAEDLNHAPSLALLLENFNTRELLRRDAATIESNSLELRELATKYGYEMHLRLAHYGLSLVKYFQTKSLDDLLLSEQRLSEWSAVDHTPHLIVPHIFIAELFLEVNDEDTCNKWIQKSAELLSGHKLYWGVLLMHALKGEIAARNGNIKEAFIEFEKGINIAFNKCNPCYTLGFDIIRKMIPYYKGGLKNPTIQSLINKAPSLNDYPIQNADEQKLLSLREHW